MVIESKGELVSYQVDQNVALITWDRTERNNAWTPTLERIYFARLRQAADDPEVRTIVVTGAGRHFCPGADFDHLSASVSGDHSEGPEHREPQTYPLTIPKPIIVAIHGVCAGTGFVQAAVADVRFATRNAKITPVFARRGIMAEQGLDVLLPQIVGTSRALDILLSARVMSGEEAYDAGFVTHVSDPSSVIDDALSYARELAASCSPLAMAVTKAQIYRTFSQGLHVARRESLAIWSVLRQHDDFAEGVQSFRDGRPPRFLPLTTGSYQAFLDSTSVDPAGVASTSDIEAGRR